METGQHRPGPSSEPRILERAEHPVSRRDIDPRVLKVLYRLINAGHTAYLVGGGVRDLMMGRRPKDFDVATSAHPQQVRDLFRNSRLIGRRFRLVHVFFGPHNIEVATFRRRAEDVPEPDDLLIRHDNTFGTPEEDAFRRDFTVNSLFYDPQTFHVIDYAGGVADLETRLIRTIGDPEMRMREDPVRMLRAVRFAAKLGFEIEHGTRAAIERHRADLLRASVPRLVEEIYRAIGIPEAARSLELMYELGLLDLLLAPLAEFLRLGGIPPVESVTGRNLAAMGHRIRAGTDPSHALVLVCLFGDLHLQGGPDGERIDLVADLRQRGFARGDTDRMRLVLESLPHLISPSRRTRRFLRRPYFSQAHLVYEIMAPNYGADPRQLDAFIRDPEVWLANREGEGRHDGGSEPRSADRRRRRRRGRRGGRWRRARQNHAATHALGTPKAGNLEAHRGAEPASTSGGGSHSGSAAPVNRFDGPDAYDPPRD